MKLLVTFGVGCLIGIVLVCAGIVSFTDMKWNELVQKLAQFLVMMCFAGVSLGLLNGIPFKRGITNDAANVCLMRKYPKSKKAMMVQLRVNAYIQEGIRIKDMPEEWFAWEGGFDYGEPMQLNLCLMQVGRLMDLGQRKRRMSHWKR